jgi:plasmid stabilization system protein ParE
MKYSIEISSLAKIEIVEAFNWYESQRLGLGEDFLQSLESFFSQLLDNPYTHSYYEIPTRYGLLKRFPYLVVYEINLDVIVVYSVFMQSRKPRKKI